ncbi:Glycosyltransferase involved in cell wall bisynthesis [Desulfatibacillum alkenivorans DSM 16219]|jgi:glycosyltransferase involved in cell wall biosynthesis|uniref:Glycosyltransferase involved in cell wall bisynthesis n=1 Tax=Desulfatibacillum alkenivorans DSM 16219 TaxID=1121393 RepID=A0A1M6UFU1_9BACT|nr:glycosyltransferase [Desulfatibacillum alkenivorans]SHK68047.1 Glycosyltransferase involved in cell wall bisynthesis [Desulfatibacillum alkenivorans DSM 16219]
MMSNNKIGILLISNGIGGAEKRFKNYFNYMNKKYKGKVYFIVNQTLYELLLMNNLIQEINDIIVLDEPKCIRKFFIYSKYKFSFISKIFTLIQRFNIALKITNVIRLNDIDIVHGILDGIRYLPLISKSIPKTSVVASVVYPELSFLKKRQLVRGVAICNAVDCLNQTIYDTVISIKGVLKSNVSITSNSFTDYTKCKPSKIREMNVVFCARLESMKNPFLFIDMAELIGSTITGKLVRYTIIGNGTLSAEVHEKAKKLRDKGFNLKCLGFISNPSTILNKALVFVQPTKSESHATQSLLEAMGCGCAVVSTNLPGIECVIPPNTGFLCDLDARAFAEKVSFLLNNYETATRMGQMGKKHVEEHFSINTFAEYLLNLYKGCQKVNKIQSSYINKLFEFIKTCIL